MTRKDFDEACSALESDLQSVRKDPSVLAFRAKQDQLSAKIRDAGTETRVNITHAIAKICECTFEEADDYIRRLLSEDQ